MLMIFHKSDKTLRSAMLFRRTECKRQHKLLNVAALVGFLSLSQAWFVLNRLTTVAAVAFAVALAVALAVVSLGR